MSYAPQVSLRREHEACDEVRGAVESGEGVRGHVNQITAWSVIQSTEPHARAIAETPRIGHETRHTGRSES